MPTYRSRSGTDKGCNCPKPGAHEHTHPVKPNANWSKADLLTYAADNGIYVPYEATKADIVFLIEEAENATTD